MELVGFGVAAVAPEQDLDRQLVAGRGLVADGADCANARPAPGAIGSAARELSALNCRTCLRAKNLFVRQKVLSVEMRTRDEAATAFAAIARARPDGLVVLLDSLMAEHRHEIVDFAAKNRLPAIYAGTPFVEAGGLLVYSEDFHELWRRAAVYVDRILRGAKPADLPVEQPTKFELVINLKTAKALGLTIPPSLLARADQVIE